MAKTRKPANEGERQGRVRPAGELLGKVGGASFRRFGFVQDSLVSRWKEIVGEKYAAVSQPESIRFPHGARKSGMLTLLVEGAHAPLMQHVGPMVIERVNRFFGYEAITKISWKQGRIPGKEAKKERPKPVPVPKELGEGLREIADPGLRACLESLAGHIAASTGGPEFDKPDDETNPNHRSKQ